MLEVKKLVPLVKHMQCQIVLYYVWTNKTSGELKSVDKSIR